MQFPTKFPMIYRLQNGNTPNAVYLRFMRFVIKGNAIPLLKVSPEPVRYIGTLQAGKKYEHKHNNGHFATPSGEKVGIFC